MKRAKVFVDLANKSCHITGRRRFHGTWGPDITRREVEGVIAAEGWRFAPNSDWVMTIDGGTREVERPGAVRRLAERLIEQIREAHAIRASDRLLDSLGSATPAADEPVTALLLDFRNRVESRPMPALVDTPAAMVAINLGRAA